MFGFSDKKNAATEAIAAFQKKLAAHDDIIYGVALFFECLTFIHSEKDPLLEKYRQLFRTIIQKGGETTQAAAKLVEEVKKDARKAKLFDQFTFAPCQDHPKPAEMVYRAEILLSVYQSVFPGRSRAADFTPDEVAKLIEESGELFRKSEVVTP